MSDFDDIRPYDDEEVRDALDALVNDPELTSFIANWFAPRLNRWFPGTLSRLVAWYLTREVRGVQDIRGFQNVVASYAEKLVREGTTEFTYEGFEKLEPGKACLFISNHRDIAGDSMLLDYALYLNDLETVRIAIGDNLVQRDFATSLMRLNKGFFIKRSAGGPRKAYAALLQSSEYISHSLQHGHSIWIAQSQGRSKDGFDLTDPAIIKMFVLAHRKRPLAEVIRELNIVPLSISYEFDPCDVLKARELGRKAREGAYIKPPGEDLVSLVRDVDFLPPHCVDDDQKLKLKIWNSNVLTEFASVDDVAAEIDRQILSRMELFPVNYWALQRLEESPYRELAGEYDDALNSLVTRRDALELTNRLRACPLPDREYFLRMYANPVVNRHRLLNQI